ncbi:MAG TPA: alanine racemase [Polyangiaceae bacterium]
MNPLELETPSLFVDLDVLERNLTVMQARCRAWNVGLRPHTKTHKIPEIAKMQLEAGAIGITVAKLGEAEVLPGDDVLVAYPVMEQKVPRLRRLLESGRRVTVVVDSVEAARMVKGIGALVEMDIGVGRCGVQTIEQLVSVARACTDFRGIFYWPSWLDEEGFRKAETMVRDGIAALGAAGLTPAIVSGGSTPGASKTPIIPQTTEIRPGTYVFYDANSMQGGFAVLEDCALKVLVTVVSTSIAGQCIIDGGSKTFSSDSTMGIGTFGHFCDRAWSMTKMNEEHGYVTVSGPPPRVGEKVWVIPSHVCSTVNLHDEIFYGRGGEVQGFWKVAARGKVR